MVFFSAIKQNFQLWSHLYNQHFIQFLCINECQSSTQKPKSPATALNNIQLLCSHCTPPKVLFISSKKQHQAVLSGEFNSVRHTLGIISIRQHNQWHTNAYHFCLFDAQTHLFGLHSQVLYIYIYMHILHHFSSVYLIEFAH